MQLPHKIDTLLKPDSESFLCCSGKDYQKLFRNHTQKQSMKLFQTILNQMGELSAKSQGLKAVITSGIKFLGCDHRIYIKIKENKVLGFVKVGEKNLFFRDYTGSIKEIKPTCVLDIYVHQSCQRSGIGKEVFQKFIREQAKRPQKLAYDRPSQKLISFLKKHYNLVKYIPQNNNFVVFDRYFSNSVPTRPQSYTPQITTALHHDDKIVESSKKQEQPQLRQKQEPSNRRQFTKQMLLKSNKINHYHQPSTNISLGLNTTNPNLHKPNKNSSSEQNPLTTTYLLPKPIDILNKQVTFRTTSNTYGSHYTYRRR